MKIKLIKSIIGIIIVLVVIALGLPASLSHDWEEIHRKEMLRDVEYAIEAYYAEYGVYPNSNDLLDELAINNSRKIHFIRNRRNKDNEVVDNSVNKLKLERKDDLFIITYPGPDKLFSTSDDLIKKIKINL